MHQNATDEDDDDDDDDVIQHYRSQDEPAPRRAHPRPAARGARQRGEGHQGLHPDARGQTR